MNPLLDNIFWHTLAGRHSQYSTGTAEARRYAPGFSPIVGFANAEHPDFAALAPYCELGEPLYCSGWTGIAPTGWRIAVESTMFQMVWEAAPPAINHDPAPDRLRLTDSTAALELAALTHPGPFGLKTIELGEYWGYFEDQRLVAMAGERMRADGLREVSGVCTHPDFQGRGMARRLINHLIRRQLARGETSFLHVMRDNAGAHFLYQRMGFRDYSEPRIRVIARC